MTTLTQTNTALIHSSPRLDWKGIFRAMTTAMVTAHRNRQTRRVLMEMSSIQRRDVGLDRLDPRSACEMEIAARRQLELGMPTDWR